MRIVTIILVLIIAAGVAWYMGWLKVGADGTVTTAPPTVAAPEMDDFDRSELAFTQSQYAEAIDKAKKAMAANPKSPKVPDAMYRIAKSLDQLDKPKEAAAAYKEFIAKNPTYDKTALEKASKRAEFLANSSAH